VLEGFNDPHESDAAGGSLALFAGFNKGTQPWYLMRDANTGRAKHDRAVKGEIL
jgi:hypothetical protein